MASRSAALVYIVRSLGRSRAVAEVQFSDGEVYLLRVASAGHIEEGGDVAADVVELLSAAPGAGVPAGACMNFYIADVAEVAVGGRRVYPK